MAHASVVTHMLYNDKRTMHIKAVASRGIKDTWAYLWPTLKTYLIVPHRTYYVIKLHEITRLSISG